MKPFYKTLSVAIIALLEAGSGYCQVDTVRPAAYENMSLKDLLNVKIVSVSKNSEPLFDAPLSASVLTREEIRRAGCTSIMEALRLMPGTIVREQSNGNYDIHLRGMDNIPPNTSFDIASTTLLVMIDNRPVYSYLRGGTFWETLPVDMNDVERIEVIRGPAAALYGPNAVNGVINIITRQAKKEGLYLVVNSQAGSQHTFINNASIGYKSNKWSMVFSGNYQHRNRAQTSYYEFNRNELLDHPAYFITFLGDTSRNTAQRYPYPDLAMKKYAGNAFFHYAVSEKVNVSLAAGLQHSVVQKVSAENDITPLSTAFSDSKYFDLRARAGNLSAQVSLNGGIQLTDYNPGNKYNFNTADINLEYNYSAGNFSIKPGIAYKSAIYDDTKYSDLAHRAGIFNARGHITTQTASLHSEYSLLDKKLRLVAALATNKFNYPDQWYFSTELAITYKVNKDHLFRLVRSHAPRSSNVFDTYADQAISLYQTRPANYNELAILGNKDLNLLTADMVEGGYRGHISSRLNIDAEVFDIHSKNHNIPVQSHPIVEYNGADTVHETPYIVTNLPLRLVQQGISLSLSYTSKSLTVKPFVTLQRTMIKDYVPYLNTPDAGVGPNNIYSGMGTRMVNRSTPTVFGGAYLNYLTKAKINFNLNAYYYTAQTYQHLSNILFNDGVRGVDHLSGKVILNACITYEPVKRLSLFCTAKNILDNRSREFFHSDAVPFMLLGGISYEF